MNALQISFDCLPLRSVARLETPVDLLPEWQTHYAHLRRALQVHGAYNSYYLCNGLCEIRLSNDPKVGTLTFSFEGTVVTDANDAKTQLCQLYVELKEAVCDWLTPAALAWFRESVTRAVAVEFDRYIAATNPVPALWRIETMEAECDACGGFVAMGL